MNMHRFLPCLFLLSMLLYSCQQELFFEEVVTLAEGILQENSTGDCLPKTTTGDYTVNQTLSQTSNVLMVVADITQTGSYKISTDTINGFYFAGEGMISVTGLVSISLQGNGKPTTAGLTHFTVTFNNTSCTVSILVGSGTGTATFELIGSGVPASCGTPIVSGSYVKNMDLNSSNTVRLNVYASVAGTYNIVTNAVNGIVFSGSGSLSIGAQAITLTASGKPANAGFTSILVNAGTTPCSFIVIVTDGSVGTDWQFQINSPSQTLQGATENAYLFPVAGVLSLNYAGFNTNDDIDITLNDASGSIQVGETYSTDGSSPNSARFVYLINAGITSLTTDATRKVSLVVTAHDPASKTIRVTFSGAVKNSNNVTRTIPFGQFSAKYD